MLKENIKSSIITSFKVITYLILWLIFMLVMSDVNYALTQATRTAVITSAAYLLVLVVMQNIYGDFEIGYKKSKPVFLTTMISVLLANSIGFITMTIMGVVQFPVKSIIFSGILHLIITYTIQALAIWILAHLGNSLFFKLYSSKKTIIIYDNDLLLHKIKKYVEDHDKQYELVEIYKSDDINQINLDNIEMIFALGINTMLEKQLIEYCYKHKIHFIYSAGTYDLLLAQNNTFVIDDILLIEIYPKEITLIQAFIKRIIDILGAIILLIISIPIFIVVAIAIKIEDQGPVFFMQERLTKNHKVFKIIKFRSMKIDSGDQPADKNDKRITKVGHIIRKLRIDELPQAINILKGDISLVGPRPESVSIATKYSKEYPEFNLRLQVKAGLTGYAQIFGKYNTTPKMKLILDLKYIENFSILEDLKLILQTLTVFVRADSTE